MYIGLNLLFFFIYLQNRKSIGLVCKLLNWNVDPLKFPFFFQSFSLNHHNSQFIVDLLFFFSKKKLVYISIYLIYRNCTVTKIWRLKWFYSQIAQNCIDKKLGFDIHLVLFFFSHLLIVFPLLHIVVTIVVVHYYILSHWFFFFLISERMFWMNEWSVGICNMHLCVNISCLNSYSLVVFIGFP